MEDSDNKDGKSGFGLPPGYFQVSGKALQDKLEWLDEHRVYPLLANLDRRTGFSVPEAYFDKCGFRLELGAYPLLEKSGQLNPFAVPGGYFESSAKRLSAIGPVKARVITLRLFRRVTLAAAALLVLSVGIALMRGYFTPEVEGDCQTMACLDKRDLTRTRQLETLDEEDLYDLADPSMLINKLEMEPDTVKKSNR
jgi:hypothetical protein